MRTSHAVVCACFLLTTAGAIAAGCVQNTVVVPEGGDAGLFGYDAGPGDAGAPPHDATTEAASDSGTVLGAATIDFGPVNCGTGTASKTYSFTNTTPASVTYSASIPSGAVFSITSGASGTVAPGAAASITLAVSAIPTTSTAGTPITSSLTVTVTAPEAATVSVPLTVTPQGGSISVSPATAAFGQAQLAYGGAPIPLAITNTGNAPVTITFGAPIDGDGGVDPAFGLVYAGSGGADASVTLAAGGSLADAGATFVPATPGPDSVTVAIQTGDPLCASATGIAMSGTGTTAEISVGPSPLQFGVVPCGDAGTARQVTLTNSSPGPVGFTASLGLGAASPFVIDVTDGGTVPGLGPDGGPGTAVITVTPKTIPVPASIDAGAFDDTLLVTPSTPFVSATPIALVESAEGAILSVTVADGGAFGTVESPEGALSVTVTNTGNVSATVNMNPNQTSFDAGTFYGDSITAAADGGTGTGVVEFQPAENAPASVSLTTTTTAPICAPLPAPLLITATGEIPIATFSATPIALTATCGAGVGPQGALTITNSGQGPLVIQSASSTSGKFTIVSAIPMTIAQGNTGQIKIEATAVGQGTAAGTVIDDTLSFTTNEISTQTEPRTAPVHVTLSGANLSYQGLTANTIDMTDCSSGTVVVQNTGDVDATVTGAGSYPTDGVFTFSGTFSPTGVPIVTAGGGTLSDSVSANLCASTAPCDLSAPAQSFTSVADVDGGSTTVGICIPLPPLTVKLNLPGAGSCQSQCCT